MMPKLIIYIFSFFLLTACANRTITDNPELTAGLSSINSSVEFLSPDRSTLPPGHFTNKVILLFPYISGGIFGNPDSAPLFYNYLTGDLTFSLDLASARRQLHEASSTLSPEWIRHGLNIQPVETRISRIGTFAYNAETAEPIGAGGFIDENTRDNLILIYVDRACQITGDFTLGNEFFVHTITLPTAGFHWLRVHNTGPEQFELKRHPHTNDIKFSIHLLQLKSV